MGAARRAWDAAEHPRGTNGRFARTGRVRVEAYDATTRAGNRVDESARAPAAFAPPTPGATRRRQKSDVTNAVQVVRSAHDKRQRGLGLTREEERAATWASPKKIAEQRAKTGDDFMPRREALVRARSLAASSKPARVGLTRAFAGKPRVVRGHGPEHGVPLTSAGKAQLVSRSDLAGVRDEVSVKRPGAARQLMGKGPDRPPALGARHSAPEPKLTAASFVLTSDAAIKDMARSLGIPILPRAGRTQLIAEILKHQ